MLTAFPLLLSVHIFAAKAYPKLEEGAVCHSTGQCSSGSHCPSAEKAGEKKEAGDTREGGPEDSGNTWGTDEDGKTLVIKERCALEEKSHWKFWNDHFTLWLLVYQRLKNVFLSTGQFPGRQMMSPSTRSNDTLSGISSLAPSKHSSSSHSLASVSFTIYKLLQCHFCLPFSLFHIP